VHGPRQNQYPTTKLPQPCFLGTKQKTTHKKKISTDDRSPVLYWQRKAKIATKKKQFMTLLLNDLVLMGCDFY
jgi:hypothetical protein